MCPDTTVAIDCVEQDEKAIGYARKVCSKFLANISFTRQNALRFRIDKKYDLIWSAGLFDYFSDKVFQHVLKRFLGHLVEERGEIVIGNFSTTNPTKKYMELMEWNLEHRSPQRLMFLARQCGVAREKISIRNEEEGVNLFLHICS